MQDVTFTWGGEEYRVEAREVLPLIAKVEEILTLTEVITAAQRDTVPMAKLSMAFGVMLRYAGARVTDSEVYSGMFKEGGAGPQAAIAAANSLLTLMIPPEHLQEKGDGKKKAEAKGPPGASSAKRRTKPPSPGG